MATKLTTVKRQSYTVSDKLRIIQFAEQHGNRAAEREFGVSESNVRLWRKSKENLEKMPRLKRANRGKKAAWPELEVDLLAWITEKRNNGLAILPSIVRLYWESFFFEDLRENLRRQFILKISKGILSEKFQSS